MGRQTDRKTQTQRDILRLIVGVRNFANEKFMNAGHRPKYLDLT